MLTFCRYRINVAGKNTCHSLTCSHKGQPVTDADCEGCGHTHPDDVAISKTAVPMPPDLTRDKIHWHTEQELGPTGPTGPVTLPPSEPRPDLQAIETTLPAVDLVKDAERTFRRPIFHDDGSIEYPKRETDWEPPQNINGYIRDPNNKWLFHPEWNKCSLRAQSAFLKANCGCIDVIMRCNNPQASTFYQRLAVDTCAQCPVRAK